MPKQFEDEHNFRLNIKNLLGINAISPNACNRLNLIIHRFIEKIIKITNSYYTSLPRQTLTVREIQTAVKFIFPFDLTILYSGVDALTTYNKSLDKETTHEQRISRSTRANITISIPRVEHIIRNHSVYERCSPGTSVFLSGILESVLKSIIEMCLVELKNQNRKRLTDKILVKILRNDDLFNQVLDF